MRQGCVSWNTFIIKSETNMEVIEGNANIMMLLGLVSDSSVIGPRDNNRFYCREVCFKLKDGHSSDQSCG